jgi:hypothetical protein
LGAGLLDMLLGQDDRHACFSFHFIFVVL